MKISEAVLFDTEENPLWQFSFNQGDDIIRALRHLLDAGLDVDSAKACYEHALADWYHVNPELYDEYSSLDIVDTVKKLLLIASYPEIIEKDEELQGIIWLRENRYEVMRFRDFEAYEIEIDTSRCRGVPTIFGTVVNVIEKSSNEKVWHFGFGVRPEEVSEEITG